MSDNKTTAVEPFIQSGEQAIYLREEEMRQKEYARRAHAYPMLVSALRRLLDPHTSTAMLNAEDLLRELGELK